MLLGVSGDDSLTKNALYWFRAKARDTAGILADARLRDLRHSNASHAVMNGESLHIAIALLGRWGASKANRRVHLDDAAPSRAGEQTAVPLHRKLGGRVESKIFDVGYPTQMPLALLDRIIRASSKQGDTVLDPFCGCAVALVAADRLDREWAGIDLSPLAARIVLKRLRADRGPLFDDVLHRTDVPARTDLGELPNYRTHKHTLYGRQEGTCAGCHVLFPFRNLMVDHTWPQSRGEQDNIENLQLLCAACNSMKGAGTQEQLIAKHTSQGIRE